MHNTSHGYYWHRWKAHLTWIGLHVYFLLFACMVYFFIVCFDCNSELSTTWSWLKISLLIPILLIIQFAFDIWYDCDITSGLDRCPSRKITIFQTRRFYFRKVIPIFPFLIWICRIQLSSDLENTRHSSRYPYYFLHCIHFNFLTRIMLQ